MQKSTNSRPPSQQQPANFGHYGAQKRGSLDWYEVMLVISFGVAVALVRHEYGIVGEVVVPTIFVRCPALFHVFVILNAFTFTASVIGLLLHGMYSRINYFLSRIAYCALMIALFVYLSFLLPSYFKTLARYISWNNRSAHISN